MRISDWSSDVCSSDLFANEDLPKIVASALATTGLAPDRLELEITESVLLGDSNETERMFKALKGQIGRASRRERVCQYGEITVVAVALQQKNRNRNTAKAQALQRHGLRPQTRQ